MYHFPFASTYYPSLENYKAYYAKKRLGGDLRQKDRRLSAMKMRNGVSTPSAVTRAEQLLDSVEQWIKSFFVHDSHHLQHADSSLQEKTSQTIHSPVASEDLPASSSQPQSEPIGSAIEKIASSEIGKSESISQAGSEGLYISSSKPQNKPAASVIKETTSKEISERRLPSQVLSSPRQRPIASQVPSLQPVLMMPGQQQEQSLMEVLSILLMASQPIKQQEQLWVEAFSILLSRLMQQKLVQQQEPSLMEVFSVLLMASQRQGQPLVDLMPVLIVALGAR
jgi:hypothetical protein